MIELNDSTYDTVFSHPLVLVEFGATWCGPCKMMAPILEKVSAQRADVKVCKIDIDDSPLATEKHGIRSVPTVILYVDGVETKRHVGLTSYDKLITMLDTRG